MNIDNKYLVGCTFNKINHFRKGSVRDFNKRVIESELMYLYCLHIMHISTRKCDNQAINNSHKKYYKRDT